MNANLFPKMLRFVQISSALGKRALDTLATKQAGEKRASDNIPTLLNEMVQHGVIPEQQKQAAAAMLADHASTQLLLKNAVAKIAELTKAGSQKKANDLGHGVDAEKTGSEKPDDWSLNSPFVGQRTSEKKASDHAMLRGLGIDS